MLSFCLCFFFECAHILLVTGVCARFLFFD
ncbi:TPA_asm: hypothetical protein [Porphyromonas phage phage028a_KCOM2799]|uniref:Uncharacterized protein n=1 Tax=Porphyromonas phage phage028a_KCOM2799 TaxID=3154118 RepID=A0AAT9J968_9CAUD